MTPCEWCGHDHAKDALCASRPKWSRRGFLALFGAGIAGAVVAAKIPFVEYAVNTTGLEGTIGGIERATFSFWRNGAPLATANLDNLKTLMRTPLRAPDEQLPLVWATDRETLKLYERLLTR